MDQTHEIYAEAHDLGARRIWDTAQVSQEKAFDFYREGICSAFMPLRPEPPVNSARPFRSRHVAYSLGEVALNIVTATPHPVFKDKREIAASNDEYYYINLQLAGRCRISQADEAVEIRSGQIAVFDSARPFALDHGQTDMLQVMSLMVPKTRVVCAPLDGPRVLSDHPIYGLALRHAVAAIAPTVRDESDDAALRLRDVVLGLTELALYGDTPPTCKHTRSSANYGKLCDLIRRHCREPRTNVSQIAGMAGLSVGTVRNIFTANKDTFGRRLLNERVALAKRVLRDPRYSYMTVAAVAYSCGFSDAAHFGRAFKASTGIAPGVWRKSSA
jgi:AraC-like DNA-binding protein